MIEMSLAEIADIVGGRLTDVTEEQAAELRVTGGVEFDSRAVGPGTLFLALPGARADGHDFAAAAVAAGAVAVLAARPVGVPAIVVDPVTPPSAPDCGTAGVLEHDRDGSGAAVLAALAKLAAAVAERLTARGLTIIGITGSSGKTSTKDLIAAVLTPLGEVVAPPGSFNNELGHPWTVLRANESTDFLVLEMSARHRGNIAALAAIAPPSVAVVLNVGTAHLGEFGSREAIAETKAELPQAVPDTGVVVLNADDPVVAAMAAKTAARVVRVGRSADHDVWADEVRLDPLARPHFTLHAGTEQTQVQLAVHGDHQVSNALCAAAVALHCGATLEQVAASLAEAAPVSQRRMQVTTRPDGVTVINDAYNANPDSMAAGLKALAWMARGKRSFAVLGEMAELGDDAIGEHDRIGRLAVRLDVSRLIVVGTGRPMSAMLHGAVMEGSWGSEATAVADADAALTLLRAELAPGDVVLVKASNSAGLGPLADTLAAEGGAGIAAGGR
ncbi:UDP-N-acetylmuramoyl-tripeptide--D-alanyl-D-alanine ligase [Mycobacterium sp. pV006]|uniref:UDP-N-acetylmuramoyl-tripeptide--D-alanyl-D- alanine ligase n=1 Tax=Mycobacterium sp. pV006 TaxID=3238983 RepID=UPI00351ACD21